MVQLIYFFKGPTQLLAKFTNAKSSDERPNSYDGQQNNLQWFECTL